VFINTNNTNYQLATITLLLRCKHQPTLHFYSFSAIASRNHRYHSCSIESKDDFIFLIINYERQSYQSGRSRGKVYEELRPGIVEEKTVWCWNKSRQMTTGGVLWFSSKKTSLMLLAKHVQGKRRGCKEESTWCWSVYLW
jgi:hypothetical protein